MALPNLSVTLLFNRYQLFALQNNFPSLWNIHWSSKELLKSPVNISLIKQLLFIFPHAEETQEIVSTCTYCKNSCLFPEWILGFTRYCQMILLDKVKRSCFIYLSVCSCVYRSPDMYELQMSEVNSGYSFSGTLSNLILTQVTHWRDTYSLNYVGWPVSSRDPPVSDSPVLELQVCLHNCLVFLTQILKTDLRSSCLHSKHFCSWWIFTSPLVVLYMK